MNSLRIKRSLFRVLTIVMCLMMFTAERSSTEDMKESAIESEIWHEIEELNKAFARNDVTKYFLYIACPQRRDCGWIIFHGYRKVPSTNCGKRGLILTRKERWFSKARNQENAHEDSV